MTHLVLVLGFHRSGTSLITKSLECLGVELGPLANWSAPDNPSGFWEDREILALDQVIMAAAGGSWDTLGDLVFTHEIIRNFAPVARRIAANRLREMPLWGLKEPRMCRLLPFWRPIFNDVADKVSVVHVTREPGDVARSLLRRNGMEQDYALRLRDLYEDDLKEDINTDWSYASVTYEEMLSDPAHIIYEMSKLLNLPINMTKTEWFIRDYLEKPAYA